MNAGQDSRLGLPAVARIAIIGMLFALSQVAQAGPRHAGSAASAIAALLPSGAGRAAATPQAAPDASAAQAYLGGTKASGRVAEVYVKVAEDVFLAADRAPEPLRQSGERWVDIEFPVLLADAIGSARAMLNRSEGAVQVGDVVEIKFAHHDNPRFFPVKELTRVTQLVARKDEMLAQDFERRILARNGHRTPRPQRLALAPLPPSSLSDADRAGTGYAAR